MPKFNKLQLKKVLTLDQIASQLANDIIGAVYSAVGNKLITEQRDGDDLYDVVDHALSTSGMSEDLVRLSSTRIEFQVGLDVSASMFNRFDGRPIVPGVTMLRTLGKAFNQVSQVLPPNVFKYGLWLWAVGSGGHGTVCLTNGSYSTYGTEFADQTWDWTDQHLESISKNEPRWSGSGTRLAPMVEAWSKWNNDLGDQGAHKLDIALTDGAIHDVPQTSDIQVFRQVNKYEGVLFNIGNYDPTYAKVPNGFTNYPVKTHMIGEQVREVLFSFIQKLF